MLNRIILVGRLVNDVELRKTNSGMSVGSFTIAVDNAMTNADGTKGTCFIDVTCWDKLAESVAQYTSKGKMVGVDGKLNQRKFQDSKGNNRSVIEVVADSIKFLESKPKENNVDKAIDEELKEKPKAKPVARPQRKR